MKYIYLLFTLLFCLHTPNVYAQKNIQGGKSILKAALSSAPSRPLRKNFPPEKISRAAAALKVLAQPSALERSIAQAAIRPNIPPSDGHIFQAVSAEDWGIRFSGTVFSVIYQGKLEIYGVIATHSIASADDPSRGLGRNFIALFTTPDGKKQAAGAKIVAVSSTNTLDLALVQFSKQAAPYLRPYPLGEIIPDSPLHSLGYNNKGLVFAPKRHILRQNPISLITSMPVARVERAGLCGSAVLNENNELVGIHTGSAFPIPGTPDQAYATHSFYLKSLVEAYHHNGRGRFPLQLTPDHSLDLNIDEHIEFVHLLDANYKVLWRYDLIGKFSITKVQEALEKFPHSKFLKLGTKSIKWEADEKSLQETFYNNDEPNIYFYDLQNRRLLGGARF